MNYYKRKSCFASKKYSRIVEKYAEKSGSSLMEALDAFYNSKTYRLIDKGVSDIHCMSYEYLAKELYFKRKDTLLLIKQFSFTVSSSGHDVHKFIKIAVFTKAEVL